MNEIVTETEFETTSVVVTLLLPAADADTESTPDMVAVTAADDVEV